MNKSCSRCGTIINIPEEAFEVPDFTYYDLTRYTVVPCENKDCNGNWAWERKFNQQWIFYTEASPVLEKTT